MARTSSGAPLAPTAGRRRTPWDRGPAVGQAVVYFSRAVHRCIAYKGGAAVGAAAPSRDAARVCVGWRSASQEKRRGWSDHQ